jgi:DNA-binding NarL/FixJ family response regulator
MVLQSVAGVRVVGEATNGQEAVEMTVRLSPAVALLDVRMPGVDGVQAAKMIKQRAPRVAILMLTAIIPSVTALTMFHGAADGYILKSATPSELVDAVRCVAAGRPYLQGELIRQITGAIELEDTDPAHFASARPLTAREIDVVRMMASHRTNREIAESLLVGEETVRTHVRHVLQKLAQPDRSAAVLAAIRSGLLDTEGWR